jgi:hypothetical protein
MTKRDFLKNVMELEGCTAEMKEVAEKMIAQLDAKSSKPTKAQKENMVFKAKIAEFMVDKEPMTASAIASEVGLSTNKVASLLRSMEGVEKIPGEKSKDSPKYRLGEVATE